MSIRPRRPPGAPVPRRRRRTPVAIAAGWLVLLAGCSIGVPPESGAGGSTPVAQQSRVDVDTPELRAAKRAAGIADCAPGAGPAPADDGLPEVTLPCLGGGRDVALSDLKGPLVINLFAQWCKPCRDEMPLYQRLHDEAGDRVRVLGVDYLDTQPGAALALARETGVTYPLLADPDGRLRSSLRVSGLPRVVFVDEDGRVTHPEVPSIGVVVRSYDELTGLVAEHLGIRL
jgi:thiol-disulfide isomerase/thioredoxin